MNIHIATLAALLSVMAAANTRDHIVVEGYVREIPVAESMTESTRQALSEIVPVGWEVFVEPGVSLSADVNVEGETSWLDNLERIGEAEGALITVDAHEMRITLQRHAAYAQLGRQ